MQTHSRYPVRELQYVYIWFREQAVEHEVCGAATHSRIGRFCRSDYGGPRPYSNEWTSFVKARLNCSIPGHYPFYFDQVATHCTIFRSHSLSLTAIVNVSEGGLSS